MIDIHYLIKDNHINSNPCIKQTDVNINFKFSFNNTNYRNYSLFKDELNRNLICYVEKSNYKFIPKICDFENELIQTYGESNTDSETFYYKDVLDLSDIKDYLFISNYNRTCHVLKLNKESKLFELNKVIEKESNYISVIPKDDLISNIVILYNNYNNDRSVYELENNNTLKLFEFESGAGLKWYYPYYTYEKNKNKEYYYIIECSRNYSVRLLLPQEKDNVYKTFQIVSHPIIYNVIIIDKNDTKHLYCSSDDRKIYIFDYNNQSLLKTIENTSISITRLSNNKILGYNNTINNELLIIDTDNDFMKRVSLEKKKYFLYSNRLKVLNTNKNYLSLYTEENELFLYEFQK